MTEDIYLSENLLVRRIPSDDTRRWVVTFDHYGNPRTFDRPGFGQQFFVDRGVSFISMLGRGNDWFQYDDLPAALAAVRNAVDGAARVMTYGSSMGGYAAIRFSNAVRADACLSLSPQYSIDPRKTPFEMRWLQEASAIRWQSTIDGPIVCDIKPIVLFDPRIDDGRHVKLIAADTAIEAIGAPFTAHPITTYLNAAGLLEQVIFDILDDRFDPGQFRRRAMEGRSTNPVYLGELARRQPAHRSRLGIRLARLALAAAPGNELALHTLGKRLTDAGQHDEALGLHERAVETSGGYLGYSLPYSEALYAAGKVEAAFALAKELASAHPEYANVHSWLAHLLWVRGEDDAAREQIKIAIAMDPGNKFYRLTLMKYIVPADLYPRRPRRLAVWMSRAFVKWTKRRRAALSP